MIFLYRIAICEDESFQMKQIMTQVERYGKAKNISLNIKAFDCAELFLNHFKEAYDLVFLDIHLPGIDGIQLAKKIREQSHRTKIVFLTAHENFWPEGYKVLASRFLIKPITDESLYLEIEEVMDQLIEQTPFVLASQDKRVAKVAVEDIFYLEIAGRKVNRYTKDEVYVSSKSLAQFKKELEHHHFAQTHSSYLVNLKHVKLVGKDSVTLTNGQEVYISLRKYKQFKEKFMEYVSSL